MGVMTSKDMAAREQVNHVAATVLPTNAATFKKVLCAVFDPAPEGVVCNAALFIKGKQTVLELNDRKFYFKNEAEKELMLEDMVRQGFRIVEHEEGSHPDLSVKEPEYVIRYSHPDNEPGSPKTGRVKFTTGKGTTKVVHDFDLGASGVITVRGREVQSVIEKAGWNILEKVLVED